MIRDVYIDLYFLVNLSMDLLCLLITAALLHRRLSRMRAILAAAIGGLYAAAALLLGLSGLVGLTCDLFAAALMCTLTFGMRQRSAWRFLQPIPLLLLVSTMLGGVMTALFSLLNRLDLPLEALSGDGLSVWSFALITAVASFATLKGGRVLGRSHQAKTVRVRAVLLGREIELVALVDSGNLLRDPISGKSVIVADVEKLAGVLPQDLLLACKSHRVSDFLPSRDYARLCRLIPTKTATGNTMLLALLPDALTVSDEKSRLCADYLIAPAPLGDSAQGFDAVIGPQ